MPRTASVAKSITDYITSPARVAHSLDWRKCSGTILNIRISKNQIDLAVASHPSYQEPVLKLASIPIHETIVGKTKKVMDESVANELSTVIRDHHVCGMVVGFPVRPEGWCGSQCGRVLRVLDQLTVPESGKNTTIFHDSRPLCLYDPNHHIPTEDSWGRSPLYSKLPSSDKKLHIVSEALQEASDDEDGQAVLKIWNDFCQTHWPELIDQQKTAAAAAPSNVDAEESEWEYDEIIEDDYKSNSHGELAYSF